ncbi:unnamed protein product [Acanthosepion pharaonis]|uniref:Uncharacterized protein n=1 Tax=Acanthosepion pharaonis TaxID=158019 RepID=A0A812AVQ0_ACAPH|nr:unnamed protein product [Sepia pharaonis]
MLFLFLLEQGCLLGDQTPFFLHLFSSRPPGSYVFILRPLEGDFSKLSLKGKLALSNFVTHASFTYAQTLPAFSVERERENEPLLSKLSCFQLLLTSSPSSPFPFKKHVVVPQENPHFSECRVALSMTPLPHRGTTAPQLPVIYTSIPTVDTSGTTALQRPVRPSTRPERPHFNNQSDRRHVRNDRTSTTSPTVDTTGTTAPTRPTVDTSSLIVDTTRTTTSQLLVIDTSGSATLQLPDIEARLTNRI